MVNGAGEQVGRCVTVDMSEGGARLRKLEPTEMPDNFDLVLTRSGTVRRPCRTVWRSDMEMGVRFIAPDNSEQAHGSHNRWLG